MGGLDGKGNLKISKLINYTYLKDELLTFSLNQKTVIAIDGVAGAGKTTLANRLKTDLNSCQVVHMDDLYDGWINSLSKELSERVINQILLPFTNNQPTKYKKYNWYLETFDLESSIPNCDLLILEGVGAGQTAFRKFLAKLIWVELDPNMGFERVIARDGEGVKKQMVNFLTDQGNHFASELTQNAADYTVSGVP